MSNHVILKESSSQTENTLPRRCALGIEFQFFFYYFLSMKTTDLKYLVILCVKFQLLNG